MVRTAPAMEPSRVTDSSRSAAATRADVCIVIPLVRAMVLTRVHERVGAVRHPDRVRDTRLTDLYQGEPRAQPVGERHVAVPPPAPGQPRRLVGVERRGVRGRAAAQPADPAERRVRRLPLVPRDGARVVRGRGDRGVHERALRQHQGRPRGAARRRRGLHAGDRRADGPGWLADDVRARPRGQPVLRRHLLPGPAAARAAELPPAARGDRRRVDQPLRRGLRRVHPDPRRADQGRRARPAGSPSTRRRSPRP